jgi:ubiquinone biosynthesis protein
MSPVLHRFVQILAVLTSHATALAVGALCRCASRIPILRLRLWAARTAVPGPQRLRILFEQLGGTLLKFGQMLALQPDILPFKYCDALFDLMDRIQPVPWRGLEKVFVAETGKLPREVFESFDERPLATASVAQVHLATLNGQKVAVKIQQPGVELKFASDTRLIGIAILVIRKLHLRPLYWLIDPMREFMSWTSEELDFRIEARYLQRVRDICKDSAQARVPKIFWNVTTRRILTTQYLEGVSVLDYLRARASGDQRTLDRVAFSAFDPDAFARNAIENFLTTAFRSGVFHADLHPANLFIMPGSAVGYIDFGITGVLSAHARQRLIELTLAYARADLDGLATAFFTVTAPTPAANRQAFRNGLQTLARRWYGKPGSGPRLQRSITAIMFELLMLSRRTNLLPEREVVKYIRSAMALDGLIHRVTPQFDVGAHLERICAVQLSGYKWRRLCSPARMVEWCNSWATVWQKAMPQAARLLSAHSIPEEDERAVESTPRRIRGAIAVAAGCLGGSAVLQSFQRANLAVFFLRAAAISISSVCLAHSLRAQRPSVD